MEAPLTTQLLARTQSALLQPGNEVGRSPALLLLVAAKPSRLAMDVQIRPGVGAARVVTGVAEAAAETRKDHRKHECVAT